VPHRRPDVSQDDVMGAFRKSRQQCFVGNQVDAPGESAARSGKVSDHSPAEQVRPVVAGGLQSESQIGLDVVFVEGEQGEAVGGALAQLPYLGLAQVFIQFGLAEQHDLQQFVLLGLEVGKQS